MRVPNRRAKRVLLALPGNAIIGNADWAGLGDDPAGDLTVFAGAATPEALRGRLRVEVETGVAAMLESIRECDAFDVIELMRLRELTVDPVAASADGHDGAAAIIDLVTLMCLGRSDRKPDGARTHATQPHLAVADLHACASRLLRLATIMHAMSAALGVDDPLARLASEYQSYLVNVRKLQYESIQAKHEAALFDRPEIDALLLRRLGFTFGDFTAVRSAIRDRYGRALTVLRDETGDIVSCCHSQGREPTDDEKFAFRKSMLDFIFVPGERASFTASDVIAESTVEPARVEAVLGCFSVGFGETGEAAAAVASFLRGVNPLAKASLVRDRDGNYITTGSDIGTDSFRAIAESALKTDTKAWDRYKRTRTQISEAAALAAVSQALDNPPTYSNLQYYAPKQGQEAARLGSSCLAPQAVGDQTECDGLFLIDDVAVCIEVKGRTVADQARRGDRARLATEIKNIFKEGAEQAQRLGGLITTNSGLWLGDGSWLDLSAIREVRSIVAGLDDFGPLAVALGDLQRARMLGEGPLPWIASLHDLEVISKVIDRPAEFLLYLRRRADSAVATYYRGADELDLFMLFMNGSLYVEEDPDQVRLQHPASGPPRPRLRKLHQRDARPTLVGTHTDPLDAWMYQIEGTSPYQAPKPVFNTHPAAGQIVDFLADGRKPGWLRFGADLLSLSGTTQKQLGNALRDIAAKTRADGRWHSVAHAYAGTWGHPILIAASTVRNGPQGDAKEKLRTYLTAKKHQLRSDRALGLLLTQRREIVYVAYLNSPATDDPGLDALGVEIGLKPPGIPLPPPAAPRATRRLNSGRKRKNRH